jgi:hypothetical protein
MKEENKVGPKYHIDIEGTLFPWDEETITTEQIINLGGWTANQGAIMIDMATNIEVTLQPGQIIELKPGLGFSKKHKFKRG